MQRKLILFDGQRERLTGDGVTNVFVGSATLAEINAGKVLIPGRGARSIRVLDFVVNAVGTFADLTDIRLSSTAATPDDLATMAVAQLDDAILRPGDTGVTMDGDWPETLSGGLGVQVRKTGSTGTGGTRVDFQISYQILNAGL